MSKHEQKLCPRCNSTFECKPGNITQCQCNSIQLTDSAKEFIEKEYSDCLCLQCLRQISESLAREKT